MFKTVKRALLPNPFDSVLKKAAKAGHTRILLGWNRGLGDIALGLYAMVQRIHEVMPEAEITFLIRENLKDGFSMLENVKTIIAPSWKRGEPYDVKETLERQQIDLSLFDLIIDWPNPTDWVRWQLGKVVPRLNWSRLHDDLWKNFSLTDDEIYIGAQVVAETQYGLWRNWPLERWSELVHKIEKRMGVKLLLFGFGNEPLFDSKSVIDLRGKTNLFELLSIIKRKCHALIVPDSGILSMTYFLDENFPLRLISLWGDPKHGVLKQNVASPNPQLIHRPLIGAYKDLSTVTAQDVWKELCLDGH